MILYSKPIVNKILENINNSKKDQGVIGVIYDSSYKDSVSYVNSIFNLSLKTKITIFKTDVSGMSQKEILNIINITSSIDGFTGILIIKPINVDYKLIKIPISKDIDCINESSYFKPYIADDKLPGFYPCTAESCIKMISYYFGDNYLDGKNVAVIGRSLTVGKPLANMLCEKNATVTLCHSHTNNIFDIIERSDIVISAIGKANYISGDKFKVNSNQIFIDCGINFKDNKLCGDIDFNSIEPHCKAITPVPKGIGSLTTAILLEHASK